MIKDRIVHHQRNKSDSWFDRLLNRIFSNPTTGILVSRSLPIPSQYKVDYRLRDWGILYKGYWKVLIVPRGVNPEELLESLGDQESFKKSTEVIEVMKVEPASLDVFLVEEVGFMPEIDYYYKPSKYETCRFGLLVPSDSPTPDSDLFRKDNRKLIKKVSDYLNLCDCSKPSDDNAREECQKELLDLFSMDSAGWVTVPPEGSWKLIEVPKGKVPFEYAEEVGLV